MKTKHLFLFLALPLLVAGKTQHQPLNLYSSMDQDFVQKLIEKYKQDTGQPAEFTRLSTGEAVAKIRSEKDSPKASVWFGGPGTEYALGSDEGLFESYTPKTSFQLSGEHRDKNWKWSGLYLGPLAFASNKDFLKKNGLTAPTSWQDLLKSQYKGNVSFAFPYTSGTALTILLSVVKLMGEPAALDYFKKLDGQVKQYHKSGSGCIHQVGSGEVGVCIAFSAPIQTLGLAKGHTIEMSFPREGTGYEIGGVALLRGSPNAEAGKRFIDWLYTDATQKMLDEWSLTPVNERIQANPKTIKVSSLKLVEVDMDWAAKNQKRLVAEWRKVTGK